MEYVDAPAVGCRIATSFVQSVGQLAGYLVARLLDRCTIAERHGRIVTSLHSRRTQGGHPVGRGCFASACIGTGAAVAIAVTVAAVEVAP